MQADTLEIGSVAPETSGFGERLAAFAEEQRGRTLLWVPVALVFGVWIYFGLAKEPGWLALAPFLALGVALAWLSRNRPALILAVSVITGFALAKADAGLHGTPLIRSTTAERFVLGTVEDRDVSGGRQSYSGM